jgi:rhodanese-related sulfurtransferase
VVIDVRQPNEFRSGHIPGAVSWPLRGGGAPSPAWLSTEQVVVVCASGHRSIIAGRRLVKAGTHRVASLRGGTAAWRAKGGLTLPLFRGHLTVWDYSPAKEVTMPQKFTATYPDGGRPSSPRRAPA